MAKDTAMQTYQAVGNREDLMDVITMISPEETPMFSAFGQEEAQNTYHEWLTDSLAAATANKQIEGDTYTFARRNVRVRTGAYTQIFQTPVEVSDTQRAVNSAGVEDEYSYQLELALKEHARDIEFAICSTGAGASGASGTARELKGVLSWITTNISSATANRTLTEALYNDNLEDCWDQGGQPETTFVGGSLKRQISSFTGGATKEVPAADAKLFNTVSVYQSDFGTMAIRLSRYMPSDGVANLEVSKFRVAVLRPTKNFEVAKVGSSTRGVVETELTLVSLQQAASGYIEDVVAA